MAAKYSYNELKKSAKNGSRIGRWKAVDVYTCSKYDYKPTSPYFWVLFDDGNKLVKQGYVYGTIDSSGTIDECDKYWYNVPLRESDVITKRTPATNGYSDQVIADEFFSRIDKEINALLASVADKEFDTTFTI